LIVDTGLLLAVADARDAAHERAVEVFRLREPKIVTGPVVVECDYMILRRMGVDAELRFLAALDGPTLVVEEVRSEDRARAMALIGQYRDARLGYVDATTVAIAERLRERRIATFDRRDFALVKPRHTDAFELIP
jgi:predicted nucleic acid-binding protein